jgi:hypothetical protein
MQNIITVLLVSIIVLNFYATAVLFRSSSYDILQKWLQLLLVWVLPIIGATLVLSLAKDTKRRKVKTSLVSSELSNYEYDSSNNVGDGSTDH